MPVKPWGTVRLSAGLYDLAWSVAHDDLREAGRHVADAYDPNDPATARTDRRAGYLALLAVYGQMPTALQANVDFAVAGALAVGSNFGEIGRATGMSRQAARQKWLRMTTRLAVTLSGGPRNGERDTACADADIVSEERTYWDRRRNLEVTVFSRYKKKYGSPQVYEFMGYEDASGRPARMPPPEPVERTPRPTSPPLPPRARPAEPPPQQRSGGGKARVHELAAELGLTSKQVLRDLALMGEYVQSAASTVEPAVARKLRSTHQPPE